MDDRPTQKDRTKRAFAAYLELVDTADWIRKELRGPLESFGFTIEEFRLLLLLHGEGPMSIMSAAGRRMRERGNLGATIECLKRAGYLRQETVMLPPAEMRESRIPKALRGKPRRGRKIAVISLTREGKRYIEDVLPRQQKLVKALMRVLDYRQQGTLIEMCKTLRAGDIVKFISEITMEEVEE